MAQQIINIGSANNAGDGESLRSGGDKINDNFTELYDNVGQLYQQSGHASYTDNIYVDSGTALTVTANTDTILPNNAGVIYDSQKPSDINTFYFSGGLNISSITGAFVKGETITGATSGTTAVIESLGVDFIYFLNNNGSFTPTETITGNTSLASATVDSLINPFITGRDNDNLDIMIYFKAVSSSVDQWIDIWIDIEGSVGELYRQTFSFPKGSGVERGILYALPAAYTRNTWQANGGKVYIRSNHNVDIYKINFNFDRSYKAK